MNSDSPIIENVHLLEIPRPEEVTEFEIECYGSLSDFASWGPLPVLKENHQDVLKFFLGGTILPIQEIDAFRGTEVGSVKIVTRAGIVMRIQFFDAETLTFLVFTHRGVLMKKEKAVRQTIGATCSAMKEYCDASTHKSSAR